MAVFSGRHPETGEEYVYPDSGGGMSVRNDRDGKDGAGAYHQRIQPAGGGD